jgi:hypothetical protein
LMIQVKLLLKTCQIIKNLEINIKNNLLEMFPYQLHIQSKFLN